MTILSQSTTHIFERLREGMVPDRGLKTFAVGTEKVMGEIHRVLDLTATGEGSAKFLRGDYGCGKTFISQLTLLESLEKDFAVSKVVVSPNDTPFYKFDEVYAKIVGNMQTAMAKGGAFGDCIDRWIGKIEDRLIDEGQDEDSDDFDDIAPRDCTPRGPESPQLHTRDHRGCARLVLHDVRALREDHLGSPSAVGEQRELVAEGARGDE